MPPGLAAALSRGAGCPSHSPGATGLEARWHHPGHHCGFQTILSLLPKSLGFECHIMRLCRDYRGCCPTIHLSSATCPHDHSPNQDLASGITISGTYPLTTTSQIPSSLSFKCWIDLLKMYLEKGLKADCIGEPRKELLGVVFPLLCVPYNSDPTSLGKIKALRLRGPTS